jgi:hypothetical protein
MQAKCSQFDAFFGSATPARLLYKTGVVVLLPLLLLLDNSRCGTPA